jgi:hypothetical protein
VISGATDFGRGDRLLLPLLHPATNAKATLAANRDRLESKDFSCIRTSERQRNGAQYNYGTSNGRGMASVKIRISKR